LDANRPERRAQSAAERYFYNLITVRPAARAIDLLAAVAA